MSITQHRADTVPLKWSVESTMSVRVNDNGRLSKREIIQSPALRPINIENTMILCNK